MADKRYVKELIYHITYGTATFGIVVQRDTKEIVAYAPIANKTVKYNHKDIIKVLAYYFNKGAHITTSYLEGYMQ